MQAPDLPSVDGGAAPSGPSAGLSGATDAGGSAGPSFEAMTRAVSLGGGKSPLVVRFQVEARPTVGAPVKVLVAVAAGAQASFAHLHCAFTGNDGLALKSPPVFDATDLGSTPIYQAVTVVPSQSGVLSLDATLLYEVGQHTETSTFSIPLIAQDSSS